MNACMHAYIVCMYVCMYVYVYVSRHPYCFLSTSRKFLPVYTGDTNIADVSFT